MGVFLVHFLDTKKAYKIENQFLVGIFSRKRGDSNPRYGYPYVSLANWWFQPLTQTSFLSRFLADSNRRTRFCRPLTKPLIQGTNISFFSLASFVSRLRLQRYDYFLNLQAFDRKKLRKPLFFFVSRFFNAGQSVLPQPAQGLF